MTTEVRSGDWYAEARRRAQASARRRLAERASTTWPEFAPPVALSEGPLGAVQAADREIARQTALRARAVAEFAATRPAGVDRAQGEPGAMSVERWNARPENLRSVSEWAARELVVALSISEQAASDLLTRSLTLVHRLPGTLTALEAGALHSGHLWSMLEKVAPIEDDRLRAEVEAELLRWSAGRVVSPAQLGAKARREVARRDARAAARRLEKALRQRGVHLRPHEVDGMGVVTLVATMPEAQALYRALGALADALDDDALDDKDDPRTRGEKMIDCALDLMLRPGESGLPPVQVLLTVVASLATLAGADEPGEVDGQPVPAEMIRQFLSTLTGSGIAVVHDHDSVAWEQAEQENLEHWWAEMERRVLSDALVDPGPFPDGEALEGPPADALDDGWVPWEPDAPEELPDGPFDEQAPREEAPSPSDDAASGQAPEDDIITSEQPSDAGWWAVADRAVDDASAAMLRATQELGRASRLVRTAGQADRADEADWQVSRAARLAEAEDSIAALRAMSEAQRAQIAGLLATTAGGGLVDRPRIALTDALSGSLLALTDLPGLQRAGRCGRAACRRAPHECTHDLGDRPGLGPPGPTDGYHPSAELDRFMRARDRRCRFPGCRRRVPRGGELDHHRPYPSGSTSADNLVGYCTGDHRGKHQAPGWKYDLAPDGTLTVTTPTGLVTATSPPPF